MRAAALLGVLLPLAGQNGFAQAGNAVVRGRVLDRDSGDPIARAIVLLEERVLALTAADGGFAIAELSPGTYEFTVRRLGFEPAQASLVIDDPDAQASLTIWLEPLPLQLDPVTVPGEEGSRVLQLQGFYERRAFGFGHFLTREDIEKRGTGRVRDLFQLIPGFWTSRGGSGFSGTCEPLLFLDGLLLRGPDPKTVLTIRARRTDVLDLMELLVSVGDIEGIEIYTGPSQIPPRFNTSSACPGRAIVVWTR
jgi:hypothetical protein